MKNEGILAHLIPLGHSTSCKMKDANNIKKNSTAWSDYWKERQVLLWLHCGKERHKWQIFPSGVVLETISPDEVVFKLFPRGDTFERKNHACRTQTARTSGEFGVLEQIASINGDTCMQRPNRQSKWRHAQMLGNRQSNWRVPWSEGAG